MISGPDRQAVLDGLMQVWYGERYLEQAVRLLATVTGEELAQQWRADFGRYRIKSHDLADFLSLAPWREGLASGAKTEVTLSESAE
jgi:hypothetical protein